MWPGRAYMVGEFGPETFVPRERGNILPAEMTKGMGQRTTIVNVNVRATDPAAFRASRHQIIADATRSTRGSGKN